MLHNLATHQSVMLAESIESLALQADGIYLDATFGCGGHTQAILSCLGKEGRVYAVDCDLDAIDRAHIINDKRLTVWHCRWSDLDILVKKQGLESSFNGVLFDIGVSSPQLDVASRGFSYSKDAVLDMRMQQKTGITAADWINRATIKELIDVFKKYGEEPASAKIARMLVRARKRQPIITTTELAQLIAHVHEGYQDWQAVRRIFQAIRIHINQELKELEQVLIAIPSWLAQTGRAVFISFHSLEDRLVKRYFAGLTPRMQLLKNVPFMTKELPSSPLLAVGGLRRPSDKEIHLNPRARSARMRVAMRGDA